MIRDLDDCDHVTPIQVTVVAVPDSSPISRHRLSPRLRLAAAFLVLAVVTLAAWKVPLLTSGPDVYQHVIWAQQVMHDLGARSLPLWCPDLNAGCGSPGIRLYSPAGPLASGTLGLLVGDACAGVRLALLAAFVALALLMRRRKVEGWPLAVALAATGPAVMADLFTRAAYSELIAVPLAWWLLDRAAAGAPARSPWRPLALGAASLWLLHAPTTLMVVILLFASCLLRRLRGIGWLTLGGVVALLVTAWHWLPLLDEMALVKSTAAIKGGIFAARANLLGSSSAHNLPLNAALSWTAVALLLIVLVEGWQRSDPVRAVLVVICVALASPAASFLWSDTSPLSWLQFPWRWLLPATLLVLRPLALRTPFGNPRSWALGALWLAPLLTLPAPGLVRVPRLTATESWQQVGNALERAIGSNPLLVDIAQNRPPWFADLGEQLPALGDRLADAEPMSTTVRVDRWRPLQRELTVAGAMPSTVTVRLLDYPWWRIEVDGKPATARREHGLIRVTVPAGRHAIKIWWEGNPWSRVGMALALLGLGLLLYPQRFRKT
ncbi:MAG: hypothetical protein LJE95_05025 [Acidobacteria bacterium]|nr:hypothetical protein [Acidobacteriota bacterium]